MVGFCQIQAEKANQAIKHSNVWALDAKKLIIVNLDNFDVHLGWTIASDCVLLCAKFAQSLFTQPRLMVLRSLDVVFQRF